MSRVLIIPFGLAVVASLLFSFLLHPKIAEEIHSSIVTDRYDALAKGIVAHGSLSYYPDNSPTTRRTPLYPLMLAGCLALTVNHFIALALIVQAFIHGATALLSTSLALRFSGRRAALIAGILCALHPMLLWYSGRLFVETLSSFIFTVSVFSAVLYFENPSSVRASGLALAIGIGVWCKAVYAPLLIALPLLIVFVGRNRRAWRDAGIVVLVGLLTVGPWIVRNYILTERWPVIQTVLGYNMHVSDTFVDNVLESPFSAAVLMNQVDFEEMGGAPSGIDSVHSAAWHEATVDAILVQRSCERYLHSPLFFLKKIALNTIWIGVLGRTPSSTVFLAIFQGSLLLLSFPAARRIIGGNGWRSPSLVPIWMSAIYLLVHLPVFAVARFSLILIPSLISVVVATIVTEYQFRGFMSRWLQQLERWA